MITKHHRSLRVETLEGRFALSGVIPSFGQEFGTSTLPLVQELRQADTNLGQAFCSIEKGECAVDTLALLSPPGQR